MAEPGFWTMGDQEAAGLRAYLLKGGFIVFDDFSADGQFNSGGGWANFEGNIHRALPELQLMEIDPSAQGERQPVSITLAMNRAQTLDPSCRD